MRSENRNCNVIPCYTETVVAVCLYVAIVIMVNRRWAIHYKERQTCCLRQKCRGQLKIERYYTKKTEGRRIRWDFHAQSHARIGVSSFVDGDEWMLGPHRHAYTVRLQTIEGMRGMRAHMVLMSEFIQNGSVIICDSKIVFSHWIVYFHYVAAPSMQLLALNYNPHESFSFIWGPVLFFPRPLRTCSVQRSTIEKQSLCCSLPFDYASLMIERFIVVFECQPAATLRRKEPGCYRGLKTLFNFFKADQICLSNHRRSFLVIFRPVRSWIFKPRWTPTGRGPVGAKRRLGCCKSVETPGSWAHHFESMNQFLSQSYGTLPKATWHWALHGLERQGTRGVAWVDLKLGVMC